MKNSTALFLSVLILITLAISFVSLSLPEDTNKDAAKTTEKPSVTTTVTDTGLVMDGNIGYKTIDGMTYFFKVLYPNSNQKNCYMFINSYGSYVAQPYISWNPVSFRHPAECSGYVDYGNCVKIESGVSHSDAIYVCYTAIPNCSDPAAILADLKENVFSNDDYYYVSFLDPVGESTQAPAN